MVDETTPRVLIERLRALGTEVTVCSRGSDALLSFGRLEPHVVVLSPVLAEVPAGVVAETIRRSGTQPILVGVGAGDAEAAGPVCMAGATAAVTRPYDVDELRQWLVRALPEQAVPTALTFGPLRLDLLAHSVHVDGAELEHLPMKEFELLRLLMTHADLMVSRGEIKASVWSDAPTDASDNTVDVHATRLRRRLPASVQLRTVRGLGYRLTLTG